MRHLKSGLAVIGAAVILVLAANTVSLAATGNALLLGKSNGANDITSITRTTSGSVLKLKSKYSGNAPLVVTGKGKVVNLNADTLDGIDSSKFGTRALKWVYTGSIGTQKTFTLSGMPSGTYVVTFEAFANPGDIAASNSGDCYFVAVPSVGNNRYFGEAEGERTNYGLALSGTGLVTKASGDSVKLVCRTTDGASTWTAGTSQPVRITAVPVRSVTDMGAPAAAKVVAKH